MELALPAIARLFPIFAFCRVEKYVVEAFVIVPAVADNAVVLA